MIAIVALPVDWKGAATIVQQLPDLRCSAWVGKCAHAAMNVIV